MLVIAFLGDTLRVLDALPDAPPTDGFIWVIADFATLEAERDSLSQATRAIGGMPLLDLHWQDLGHAQHPSHYDYTSVYDLIIFRRLEALGDNAGLAELNSQPLGFVVYDKLLVSVHPGGCGTARAFIDRFVTDAKAAEQHSGARNRLPTSPADLALRMVNVVVDSFLALRKDLSQQLERWQADLLHPQASSIDWKALMAARNRLHALEDLCEEQRDAMQEWIDCLREQPVPAGVSAPAWQAQQDGLIARARDVLEHIERVVHHVQRLEQSAETVVQIHFSAQSNRTNDIMRTLTALTAIFLPLNLIAGIFGMNFEFAPFIHAKDGFWWSMAGMATIAIGLVLIFWRKRYLARTRA